MRVAYGIDLRSLKVGTATINSKTRRAEGEKPDGNVYCQSISVVTEEKTQGKREGEEEEGRRKR